ncbi:DUF4783 domain-containing protein [Pararhodonellum marinum]|uniref:DUF4783 domain-containing protein n=1 Tax=Pararhodonellum marinum TaxID=2755358 RepID=UPI00188F2219|nr:DUF4783 domain-containing protein [Pararhodonellum marinum]
MHNLIAHILIFVFLFSLFSSNTIKSQKEEIEEITLSFQAGSSRDLAQHFHSNLEMNINGNQADYSKNQAEQVLRDFFKKFPPIDFQIIHRGESADNLKYFIGLYNSDNISFRVLIKGRNSQETMKIYSMDFTKE